VSVAAVSTGNQPERSKSDRDAARGYIVAARIAAAVAGLYLLSILATGGYYVPVGSFTFHAIKMWPAVVALVGFIALAIILACGSLTAAMHRWPAFLLFALALIVFLANGRTISAGDSVPAKLLPISILRNGNFYLDQFPSLHEPRIPYYEREVDGHYVSDYPVGAAIFALPFYVIPIAAGVDSSARIFAELEKISAAVIVALSVAVIYLAAAELAPAWMAIVIALVYAFATSTLSIASQALWQHGPCELALSAALYALIRARRDERWAILAGFALAVEVVSRPVDIVIAAPLAVLALIQYRRQFPLFVAATIPPLMFLLWYNQAYFGDAIHTQFFVGAGTAFTQLVHGDSLWRTPLAVGLPAVLLSPGRGLFFYSPIFLVSAAALVMSWRRGGDPLLRALSLGALMMIIVVAKWVTWTGGDSYGPRLLTDLVPILSLALYPIDEWLAEGTVWRAVFAILAVWSVMTQSIGAFSGGFGWNPWALGEPTRRMWLWSDNPVVDPFERLTDTISIALRHQPTSTNAPEQLAADYSVRSAPSAVPPAAMVHVRLHASNTGRAVWIADRRDKRGAVNLRWRWVGADGHPLDTKVGKYGLHLDVFPGESVELDADESAPDQPGHYLLEVSLVRVGNDGDSQFGSAPLLIPLEVSNSAPVASVK
jgi:hypothetical protein